jgi:hypothetical protein
MRRIASAMRQYRLATRPKMPRPTSTWATIWRFKAAPGKPSPSTSARCNWRPSLPPITMP